MYMAELLNAYGLFQVTSGWKKAEPDVGEYLTGLLFHATSCVLRINRMSQLNETCVREFDLFEDQLRLNNDLIVYQSANFITLLDEVSPFFSGLRIIQDMVPTAIGKTLGVSVPKSMSDLCSKLKPYKLPIEIKALLQEYWDSSGSSVRDYRILDQHHAVLVAHSFIQLKPKKQILICLPDNPSVRKRSAFTFEKKIDAAEFLKDAFRDLAQCIENVGLELGYSPEPLEPEMGMNQLGELTSFRDRTLAFMFEESIRTQPSGRIAINIKGLEVMQTPEGKVSLQRKLLDDEKLAKAKKRLGGML
jgi:hypothetical protein